MAKNKFDIKITGSINQAMVSALVLQLNTLLQKGQKDLFVYIETGGGEVFAATELTNVIKKFTGTKTCEIGSICASAGTYILTAFDKRIIASNGHLMIHKPESAIGGNEDDLKSQLRLLSSLTKDYKKQYAKLTGSSEDEIEALWQQDYWLNAEEALQAGFITAIGAEATIDATIAAQFVELKHPNAKQITAQILQTKNTDMKDLSLITAALGIAEDATEAQIAKSIAAKNTALLTAETKVAELQAKLDTAEATAKTEQAAKVTALVDGAIAANKIKAEDKPRYEKLATADFQSTSEILASMKPYVAITAQINNGVATAEADKYKDWTYTKFQKEAPRVLAQIKATEPARFEQLKADYLASR